MKALQEIGFAIGILLSVAVSAGAQPAGALAVDERQGDQYGWAVDYETTGSAQAAALRECGADCSVVLTFERCAAYAADQALDSNAVGWAESYGSAAEAQRAALEECSSRGGGSGCIVRVWGCNGPVVEQGLALDRVARQEIQLGLEAAGFDPGSADGMFGPRTRAAIRGWQIARGSRATGYLDGGSVTALRSLAVGQPTFRERPVAGAAAGPAAAPAEQQAGVPPAAGSEVEVVFWQSIVDSTDPADFEAYVEQFPNGAFRRLAENRLLSLRSSPSVPAVGRPEGARGSPAVGSTATGAEPSVGGAAAFRAGADPGYRPGDVFRDCAECPEMVVLPGGDLALGRYEVTVGEYRAFVSATGGTGDEQWRDHYYEQTDRHPVMFVSWDDAQAYASWLSRTTGATYRLPSESEWERAESRSPVGICAGAMCPVGSYGANPAGLSDMLGNVSEWTSDCWEGNCGRRVLRGGSWPYIVRPGERFSNSAGYRDAAVGFRVSRTLD